LHTNIISERFFCK